MPKAVLACSAVTGCAGPGTAVETLRMEVAINEDVALPAPPTRTRSWVQEQVLPRRGFVRLVFSED